MVPGPDAAVEGQRVARDEVDQVVGGDIARGQRVGVSVRERARARSMSV